jgi:hypothetical protein
MQVFEMTADNRNLSTFLAISIAVSIGNAMQV